YQSTPDWSTLGGLSDIATIEAAASSASPPLLETETFASSLSYDELSRVTSQTTPDGSVTRPDYNPANLLEAVFVSVKGGAEQPAVTNLDYNARGQRVAAEYANGTVTSYSYDPLTFRLTRVATTRSSDSALLQDLRYT